MAKDKEVSSLVPTEVTPGDLKSVMLMESEKRKLITEYIAKHMKEGVDYGTIKIGGRDSKPSLFKPGSEKFLSLFKLTATFRKDGETFEMAGSPNGLFCYLCEIKTNQGMIVGEGRGVAALSEKSWSVNSCVKIAEKRAQVDAVLRMGALSDFFTQDLEDMSSYDTSPVEDTVEVTVTGVDERSDPEPWKRPSVPILKRQIKDAIDAIVLNPLSTKEDYIAYVADNVDLDLTDQTVGNLQMILERLKAL